MLLASFQYVRRTHLSGRNIREHSASQTANTDSAGCICWKKCWANGLSDRRNHLATEVNATDSTIDTCCGWQSYYNTIQYWTMDPCDILYLLHGILFIVRYMYCMPLPHINQWFVRLHSFTVYFSESTQLWYVEKLYVPSFSLMSVNTGLLDLCIIQNGFSI